MIQVILVSSLSHLMFILVKDNWQKQHIRVHDFFLKFHINQIFYHAVPGRSPACRPAAPGGWRGGMCEPVLKHCRQDRLGLPHRDHPGLATPGTDGSTPLELRHCRLSGISAATRIVGPHDRSGQCAP
jgi:hypothetical protein